MNSPLAQLADSELAAARMGRTWPMLSIKDALLALPVTDAFPAFVDALQLPPASVLVRKRLTGAREFAERSNAFFRELEPAGESFVNRPPRVIGVGDHRVLSQVKRSLFVAIFENVATRGRSQLVEFPDEVLLDFEGEELARIDDEVKLDSAVFRLEDGEAWIVDAGDEDTILVDQCFSLLGPNSFAFGHWIVEYLPRLWIAMESGLMPDVAILIDKDMSRQHRQCLEMLLPAGTRIIEVKPMQRVLAGKLWFAPTFFYSPIYPQFNARFRYDLVAAPTDRFQRIFRGMLARLEQAIVPVEGREKIYLARKPSSHRKLVNHGEIEDVAERAGFRLVYLEDVDFVDQLRLIRRASHLVGPEGSAFFMGFFARAGTRVCILNHPHTEFLTEVTALLEAVDVDCTVLTGPFHRIEEGGYIHFSDYEIDPTVFLEFLQGWRDEGGGLDAKQ
jgi:hypothetical protein